MLYLGRYGCRLPCEISANCYVGEGETFTNLTNTEMKKLLKVMQHSLTGEQLSQLGKNTQIIELSEINNQLFNKMASSPSTTEGVVETAKEFYEFLKEAEDIDGVILPLGSPSLMFQIAVFIGDYQIPVLFSHSERVSVDEIQEDGSIKKVSVFRHQNWITL